MCADSITANYHWVKPQISGSPTTWGNKLNDDLDQIDNTVFSNDGADGRYRGGGGGCGGRYCGWGNRDVRGAYRRLLTGSSATAQSI